MRSFAMKGFVGYLVVMIIFTFAACKKWSDAAPVNDPRLTNPYCNDPSAVNYNWGFPGVPDNSVCFYPTDLFKGTYNYTDSVYHTLTGALLYAQTQKLYVYAVSKKKLAVVGLCGSSDSLFLTAGIDYIAVVDTLIGDTLTTRGQFACRETDTLNGTMTFNRLDSLLYVNFLVTTDSGQANHIGKGRKIQ